MSQPLGGFLQALLLLTALWLLAVTLRFRRSLPVVLGGLVVLGGATLVAFACGQVGAEELGLRLPASWWPTLAWAVAGLAALLAYSPIADWFATRWIAQPPTLESFRLLQQSRAKLVAGIVVAWLLGGILEELLFRGVVLKSLASWLSASLREPLAIPVAIGSAALGAGLLHFYQGPRAVAIITQLSVLFGLLFILSGYNLWAVILCHGLYDTIAFVRFANKKSRYSNLEGPPSPSMTDDAC